jgi:hypothetical protein
MNTSNNNEFKMTYLSDKYRDFDNCKNLFLNISIVPDKMLYQSNFSDVNFMKRNSTVKEFRKQKLIETQEKLGEEPEFIVEQSKKTKKGKRKHKRIKKFRDLSSGNQVTYKGKRGYAFIKKYHDKRRNESGNLRDKVGPAGLKGSVRSRNKSSDGYFSSIKSFSSDCNSAVKSKKSKSIKKSNTGFFTRNKLNAKYKAIKEAKRIKLQSTLNKVMKVHA